MTDDEREALAQSVENMMGYSGGKPVSGRKLAAQLRADGERIRALEAGFTPQTAAAFLVDEVLEKADPEAAAHRRRMIAAGMSVKVPHLTRWVRWALINAVLRGLAKRAGGEGE